VNVVGSVRTVVGTVVKDSEKLVANLSSNNIIYPGNTTERPNNTPAFVQIVANSLPDEPLGFKTNAILRFWVGSDVAVDNFNNKVPLWESILPNHTILR
jgi:hypothetical protein